MKCLSEGEGIVKLLGWAPVRIVGSGGGRCLFVRKRIKEIRTIIQNQNNSGP